MDKRREQLVALVQESINIAAQTGPRGFVRGLQAGQAVAGWVRDGAWVLSFQLSSIW